MCGVCVCTAGGLSNKCYQCRHVIIGDVCSPICFIFALKKRKKKKGVYLFELQEKFALYLLKLEPRDMPNPGLRGQKQTFYSDRQPTEERQV